jgi:hypothetical protein
LIDLFAGWRDGHCLKGDLSDHGFAHELALNFGDSKPYEWLQ